MIHQQLLPPHIPLLHIRNTSKKFFSSGFTAHSMVFLSPKKVQPPAEGFSGFQFADTLASIRLRALFIAA